MGILLTGANGYLGSYVVKHLLASTNDDLLVMVRADDRAHGVARLWEGWQLHLDAEAFRAALDRVTIVRGDLHAPELGLSDADHGLLRERATSVLHMAASLNRKSEKACLNTNLKGTLAMLQLARWLHDRQGLERFGFVSTVAIAGKRQGEDLHEDEALDWSLSDHDPYARTKKFCEHMVRQLLPDVPTQIYRPSIVMGDGHHPRTSQFDMIFATTMLADLRVLPLQPDLRVDICNADWVGEVIASVHTDPKPAHDTWHLSAGTASPTVRDITDALDAHLGRTTRFAPQLGWTWDKAYRLANRAPRGTPAAGIGALWKVFWPYVTFDTVFHNDRAVTQIGKAPVPFPTYFGALYDWVKDHGYRYPTVPLPAGIA
ncbi:MAG: SDR family oxidoreductase [Alphaproteobacteria bacterium]|nr:SDR family oxidoreductase [Alphaproteobacteria bacterium]